MAFTLSSQPQESPKGRFTLSSTPETEPEESFGKEAARTALQAPLGYLKKYPASYVPDIVNALAQGATPEVAAELEESDWINQMFNPEHPSINREQVTQVGREAIGKYAPSQENLEGLIEHFTGAPLRPQGPVQEAFRLGGMAAGFRPGGVGQKAAAGAIAPVAKETLEAIGLPPALAEIAGLVLSGVAPLPNSVGKATKPSGLTTRRFESVKKPTHVSPETANRISSKVEGDFRKIADKHLTKNKTYAELKENPNYKNEVSEIFDEVKGLSRTIPGEVAPEEVGKAFDTRRKTLSAESRGFTPSEYEKTLNKEIGELRNDIAASSRKTLFANDLETQFRKNNQSLGELFEPGKSSAANRAKKNALLEYNRAIEDVIEQKWPASQFSRLFKESNERWSQLMAVEEADAFIDSIFKDKIDYKHAKKLLDSEYYQRPFQKLLGKEGYKDIRQLVEDLASTEKPMKLIRRAQKEGWSDVAKKAVLFGFVPPAGYAREGFKIAKDVWKSLLSQPKLAVKWDHGLNAFKNGKWAQADKDFTELHNEIKRNAPKHPEVEVPKKAPAAPKQAQTVNITPKTKEVAGGQTKRLIGPSHSKQIIHQKPSPKPKPSLHEMTQKSKKYKFSKSIQILKDEIKVLEKRLRVTKNKSERLKTKQQIDHINKLISKSIK